MRKAPPIGLEHQTSGDITRASPLFLSVFAEDKLVWEVNLLGGKECEVFMSL